jgi:hypothetical protein
VKKEEAERPKEGGEKPKDEEEKKEEAPPPPPEELEMRVYMHCEGCARKVKKILKRLDGNLFSNLQVSFLESRFMCVTTSTWFMAVWLC